jgi:DNA-directed RNA polymerase specialized sigma24 family protein
VRPRTRAEGERLMLALAKDPTPQLAAAFDACFYPIVKRYVLKRRGSLQRLAPKIAMPDVPIRGDALEEAAHRTAIIACARARASAREFDPGKGSAEAWVLRAAAYAYREVALDMTDSRRQLKPVPTEGERLQDEIDRRRTAPDVHELAVARERLQSIFELLTEEEQHVILLRRDGHTREETAEILFGDAGKTSKVGRLLSSALLKLNEPPPMNPENRV